jgi:hypothetical protein
MLLTNRRRRTCHRLDLSRMLSTAFQGKLKIDLSGLPYGRPSPFPPQKCEGLYNWRRTSAPLALPQLRYSILCMGRSHRVRALCALRYVRQHGPHADIQRAWRWNIRVAVSPAASSHLSMCAVPEPIFLHSVLSPNRSRGIRAHRQGRIQFPLSPTG